MFRSLALRPITTKTVQIEEMSVFRWVRLEESTYPVLHKRLGWLDGLQCSSQAAGLRLSVTPNSNSKACASLAQLDPLASIAIITLSRPSLKRSRTSNSSRNQSAAEILSATLFPGLPPEALLHHRIDRSLLNRRVRHGPGGAACQTCNCLRA